ncbi:MAG TPA: PAS domain-containing protein, partial [Pyrinomonadaceae bacterium]|nr:PAS domain-containing protein [Pyrinomonadaceae bacterium]
MIDKKLSGATNTMPTAMSLVKELPQYESLVQSIDGIVWEAEADTFRFRFVNERAEKILGYPVEQWLAEPEFWVNHLHPADREWAVNFCLTSAQRKEDHEFEYRMIAADGREVWLRDTVTVNYAADGSTILRGVMFDITTQMTALNEVRAAEARMRLLFDQIPAMIWTTDKNLRFTN